MRAEPANRDGGEHEKHDDQAGTGHERTPEERVRPVPQRDLAGDAGWDEPALLPTVHHDRVEHLVPGRCLPAAVRVLPDGKDEGVWVRRNGDVALGGRPRIDLN